MSLSDADEFERREEDNDDEEADDHASRDEEGDEEGDSDDARDTSASQEEEEIIDERFIERVPVKKPAVSSVALRLPSDLLALVGDNEDISGGDMSKGDLADTGNGAAAVVDVQLHLTRPTYAFEKVCRRALNEMRRANVMRQLAQDVDGLRAFVDHEQARRRLRDESGLTEDDELAQGIAPEALDEMEEILQKIQRAGAGLAMQGANDSHQDESDVENAAGDTAVALEAEEDGEEKAPLYWLVPLISNDVPTLERTLAAMYGWAVPPLPPPKPPRTVSFAGGKRVGGSRSGGDGDGDEEDEDGEDLVVPDPARARPSWFKPSGAFGGESTDVDASHDEAAAESDGREADEHESAEASSDADSNEDGEPLGAAAAARTSTSRPQGSVAAGSHRGSSAYIAPMHSVPAFGDVNRQLWIVYDTASEAWHLLDEHPLLRTLRCRLEKVMGGAPRPTEDADQHEEATEEEEEESDDSDEEEEEEGSDGVSGHGQRRRRRLAGVPDYRLDSVLPVDAVVLAALLCPAALRLCLLQRRQPSLTRVEQWLWRDLDTGFPLLATVHSAIVASRATDGPRLPYPLPPMTLDFNIFFCEPFLTGANNSSGGDALKNSHRASGTEAALSVSIKGSRPHSGKARSFQLSLVRLTSSQYAKHLLCHEKQVNLISSSLSHTGRYNMEMLLASGVFPSRPVRLAAFASAEGVRLALWLLMAMPRTVLVRWGLHAAGGGGRGVGDDEENEQAMAQDLDWYGKEGEHPGASLHHGGDKDDDEEDDEEEDEEDIPPEEETIEIVCERITRQQRRQARDRRELEGPLLRLAPFPMALVLEVRRRVAREMKTKPPSQLTLLAAVGHCFKLGQVEDGKPRGDPLLTANFRLALPTPVSNDEETTPAAVKASAASEGGAAAANASDSTQRFRHQRLYQSDLVLLLLALTSTPQPRGVVTARVPGPQNLKKPSPPVKGGGNAQGTTPSTHNNPNSATRGTHWSEKAPGAAAANSNVRTERGGSILSARGPQVFTDTFAALGHSGLLSPRQAPGRTSFSVSEPAPAVSLRRRSLLLLQGSPSDAHEALFTEVLAAKIEKASATPLTLLRSGTLRLLLRALPRFCQQRVMEAFCEVVPLYQVLGQTESSPLPELVENWSAELAKALKLEQVTGMVQHRYLDAFTNRFWHELHCRLAGGLYGCDVVPVMQRQLAVLFDKVDERLKQYQDTMSSLGGAVHIGYVAGHHGGAGMASMNGSTLHDGRRLHVAGPMGTRRFTGRAMSLVSGPLSGRAGAGAAGTLGSGLTGTSDVLSNSARRARPSVAVEGLARQKSVSGASLRFLPGAGHRQSMFSMNSVEPVASATIAVAAAAAAAASTSQPGRATAVNPPLPSAPTRASTQTTTATTALVSGRQLSLYDAEFKRELTRVRALLTSLPMFPSTYITPYTLFALLFGDTDPSGTSGAPVGQDGSRGGGSNKITSGQRGVDLAAVYYVVVVQGITTVQTDPFFGVEMPALEYAVRELNVAAARMLVQLGASMHELIEGGAMTVEQYCELMLSPEEVEELRQVADIYTHHVTTNPDAHYGILRSVRSGAVGV